jgi:hypothetical protein
LGVGLPLEVLAVLLRGARKIAAAREHAAQQLPGGGEFVLRIEPLGFARALLGGLEVLHVVVANGVEEVGLPVAGRVEFQQSAGGVD